MKKLIFYFIQFLICLLIVINLTFLMPLFNNLIAADGGGGGGFNHCIQYGGEVTNPKYPSGSIFHCSPCAVTNCSHESSWFIE